MYLASVNQLPRGSNPMPLWLKTPNCRSPIKRDACRIVDHCTAVNYFHKNIIQGNRQYPTDNLGFTGYQPYRPPTEPYERACGNLLKDGWRGQQWQYVLIRQTRRCTSCRRAVKFFTELWYWWKWCLRTETYTTQTGSGCTKRKTICYSTSSTRRSRQYTWKTEIVHPTIVASDDSEG